MKKLKIFIGAYKQARKDGKSILDSIDSAIISVKIYTIASDFMKLVRPKRKEKKCD